MVKESAPDTWDLSCRMAGRSLCISKGKNQEERDASEKADVHAVQGRHLQPELLKMKGCCCTLIDHGKCSKHLGRKWTTKRQDAVCKKVECLISVIISHLRLHGSTRIIDSTGVKPKFL